MDKDLALKLLLAGGNKAYLEDGVIMVILPAGKYSNARFGVVRDLLKMAGYHGSVGMREEKTGNDSEDL